jgi:hypothetical protein
VVSWSDARSADGFERRPVAASWRRLASGYCRLDLTPVASRGAWAGQRPFEPTDSEQPTKGTVLALTRARLRPTRAVRFWRSIGPVAAGARSNPGLLAAFGIGEAPIGWQGTVSLWRDSSDLVEFAYRHPEHRAAIADTPVRRWYAEELFARFAVVRIAGDRDVIGWVTTEEQEEP